jgi:cell division protein FtsL
MTSLAHSQRVRKAHARRAAKRRPVVLGGGVVWIVVFAVLLAGVVAVNVAVLRLNLQLDHSNTERTELKADISRLRSELSSVAATSRIERLAQGELGLVASDPGQTVYVDLAK